MSSFHTRAVSRRALQAEPNVIPFIDVLLVLLIIFMVTAPQPTVDHNVDMPSGRPAPSLINPVIVDISQDLNGVSVSVDGDQVSVDALAQATFERARAVNPSLDVEAVYSDARILVRADQDAAYGEVVQVMDALQHAHFAKVGIFAQQADDG